MLSKLERLGAKRKKVHAKFDEIKKEMDQIDAEYEEEENLVAGDVARLYRMTPEQLGQLIKNAKGSLPENGINISAIAVKDLTEPENDGGEGKEDEEEEDNDTDEKETY